MEPCPLSHHKSGGVHLKAQSVALSVWLKKKKKTSEDKCTLQEQKKLTRKDTL